MGYREMKAKIHSQIFQREAAHFEPPTSQTTDSYYPSVVAHWSVQWRCCIVPGYFLDLSDRVGREVFGKVSKIARDLDNQ